MVSEEEPSVAERLALARRYLGTGGGDAYVTDNPDPGRENMAFLEPHGRFESLDALLAAPDGWHHEYHTDRNFVHDGTYRSLAGEKWVGRRSLEFSG